LLGIHTRHQVLESPELMAGGQKFVATSLHVLLEWQRQCRPVERRALQIRFNIRRQFRQYRLEEQREGFEGGYGCCADSGQLFPALRIGGCTLGKHPRLALSDVGVDDISDFHGEADRPAELTIVEGDTNVVAL
jgi:hypothetical protein